MSFEQHETNQVQVPQNIWDKIEEIQNLLANKESLSSQESTQVLQLLNEISDETEKKEGQLTHFFDDKIVSKLQQLGFRDHDLLQSPQFIDSIELLTDGEKSFSEIIKQIEQAKNSIEITIFIWRDDEIGNTLAKKLLEAANPPRNVKIIINKDRLGAIFEHAEQGKKSFFHPELGDNETFNRMIVDKAYNNEGEAKNHSTKDKPNLLLQQILNHPNITLNIGRITTKENDDFSVERTVAEGIKNDHSKYWIFDNETIITGGMNVGDEYHKDWHDYMVKMKSPLLVQKLKGRLSGEDDFDYGASIEFGLNRVKNGIVKEREIEPKMLELIGSAQNEIVIEMAYFGDKDITDAIIKKANSGIPVKIILPKQANVQDDLNKEVMKRILDETGENVSVYFYPYMLHAKMIHVDGEKTFLGSANLNEKATEDLGELNILVNDSDCQFTQDVSKQLSIDIEKSEKYEAPPKIKYSRVKAFFESMA